MTFLWKRSSKRNWTFRDCWNVYHYVDMIFALVLSYTCIFYIYISISISGSIPTILISICIEKKVKLWCFGHIRFGIKLKLTQAVTRVGCADVGGFSLHEPRVLDWPMERLYGEECLIRLDYWTIDTKKHKKMLWVVFFPPDPIREMIQFDKHKPCTTSRLRTLPLRLHCSFQMYYVVILPSCT